MSIDEMVRKLPEELQKRVTDYVQFVLESRQGLKRGSIDFSWEGALKDLRDRCSSVELQHKISEWRIGGL